MPCQYQIDGPKRRVLSKATGVLDYKQAMLHNHRLAKDPLFQPTYSQLYDFTEATRVTLTPDELLELSKFLLFSPESKRAFVTTGPVNFALARMARMYSAYRTPNDEVGIHVFSALSEALIWLDHNESMDPDDGIGGGGTAGVVRRGNHREAKPSAR